MNHLELFGQIKVFLFDIDGVLTNNKVLVMENGELLRSMDVRDGYAIRRALEAGFHIAVISGGRSEGVRKRLEALGITDIYLGRLDKLDVFKELMSVHDEWDAQNILYMGDDIPDYPVMCKVGLPTCPRDATPEVMQISLYVSPYAGGQGCVRDVIEKVLRVQHQWIEE